MPQGDRLERVNRKHRCPVCDRPDWCGYSSDGRLAVCMRVSEGAVKRTRNGGYVHVIRDDPDWQSARKVRTVAFGRDNPARANFGRLAADFAAAVDIAELQDFAEELGLTVEGLVRLGIGWSAEHQAWSLPMQDADRRVLGIRLRSWAGRKWAVAGSRQGVFIPVALGFGKLLAVAEGPTDTAALLDLGFEAVGRPSCTGGVKLLADLVRQKRPPCVVVVSDGDGPGRRGAELLAATLLPLCRSVRVICPPDGSKDTRAWKQAGARREDVQALIDAAPIRALRTERRLQG